MTDMLLAMEKGPDMAKTRFDFEKKLAELEKLTEELSQGELPLETAIDKYARGIETFKECSKVLAAAEKKVTVMTQNLAGGLTEEPFADQASFEEGASDDEGNEEV
jgi:exodeoxyribonuclease VII small subunit